MFFLHFDDVIYEWRDKFQSSHIFPAANNVWAGQLIFLNIL